ncbi:DUF4112 domain-containing protein [Mangrovicoccus algicola]|uniref:DUF4112 domain-containing protein n=1 Tax=Mangrovicoccus algicola TaxID=2771008 RepID=A0A8J7CJI1_9RHOB|nr:DUF4112 domain-containing protein [Mangrovicoccus algicola]MBE3637666.1 DUF4112 domain-containing protein [Mangrovicoccus algicola]
MQDAERAGRLARAERIAALMDARFSLFGIRFGWDSLIGLLVPGIGDAATALPSLYVIYEAHRLGARKRVLARMGLNVGLDTVLGSVPLAGDVFDLAFKANRRNVALLSREMARMHEKKEETRWPNAIRD